MGEKVNKTSFAVVLFLIFAVTTGVNLYFVATKGVFFAAVAVEMVIFAVCLPFGIANAEALGKRSVEPLD